MSKSSNHLKTIGKGDNLEKNKILTGTIIIICILLMSVFVVTQTGFFIAQGSADTIKIGWISDLSGGCSKYGAYEAGMMALEEVNKNGGINGKQVELIVEDGKCDAKTSINAMNKLVNIDGVKFVLGGHATPESAAIAPIAEENEVLMLASITTSPVLTNAGEYVFRTSPVSTIQSKYIANLAYNKLGHKTMAIVYSQTDYTSPIAERMNEEFTGLGGKVIVQEGYLVNTTDFKTILTKISSLKPDAIFISAMTPDEAYNFMKQLKELNISSQVFGNDTLSNKNIFEKGGLNEGVIIAGPDFDLNNPKTSLFIHNYKEKYNSEVPFGVFTAECYDALFMLKEAIEKVGEDSTEVAKYLYTIDFHGASGRIQLDEFGDGIREYKLKIIKNGVPIPYE